MIILDGEADGRTKEDTYNGLTLRHPQAAFTRSTSPLPDYDTSEAQHWKTIADPPVRWKLDPRFWKAGLYALVIYVLLSILIVVPILIWKTRKESSSPSTFWTLGPAPSLWAVENSNLPAPLQLATGGSTNGDKNRTCNVWYTISTSENLAKARFTLAPTGLITIRSNISYNTFNTDQLNGSLSVSMNKDYDEDDVEFNLEMKYSSEQLRQRTDICFSRAGANRGLSIYIPKDFGDDDHLEFQIDVVLPRVKSSVDSLITYLPLFSQSFGDLRSKLNINRFAVEGATFPISCKFIEASEIWVKNVGAPIDGTFNATAALTLDSIKGSITTDIFLTRPYLPVRPTLLTMDTGDSSIYANITLDSAETTEWSKGSPGFVALVKTFNGPLNLDITLKDNVPVSPLQLQVQNNFAQTSVALDSYYEGSFSVQTKLSQVFVKDTAESPRDDPANAKRPRTLLYDQILGSRASGWVGWGFRPIGSQRAVQSYVEIVSALGPVSLAFGPG